jgi:uncharacterized repeat protein (TIGR03803 family)
VLYSFCIQEACADGDTPDAGLVEVKGMLYGTTASGGTGCPGLGSIGCGTVFSVDRNTGAETVVFSFCRNENLPTRPDGYNPRAGLVDMNGRLYGTTSEGGAGKQGSCSGFSCGIGFALDPKTDAETVLHSSCSKRDCADGRLPISGLIDVNGTLYGTTSEGGADEFDGTVFSLDPRTGREKVLHSFRSGSDGSVPDAGLMDVNGTLYGTTIYGGTGSCAVEGWAGCGTVFSIDPQTGAETVVHSFGSGTDGTYSVADLTNVKGTLYGTTASGGGDGSGTILSIVP